MFYKQSYFFILPISERKTTVEMDGKDSHKRERKKETERERERERGGGDREREKKQS